MKDIFTNFLNYITPKKIHIDIPTPHMEMSMISSSANVNIVIPKKRPMRWVKLKITFKE